MTSVHEAALRAKEAARMLTGLGAEEKNRVLAAMAGAIDRAGKEIIAANAEDLAEAKKEGANSAFLDRLKIDESRLEGMVKSIRAVEALPDPIGLELNRYVRKDGLTIRKVRVPLGVVAVIYESRPNVTSDAASLCLKSSNAVILRGGKEALRTNGAIAQAMQREGEKCGLPVNSIQLVQSRDRSAVAELVQLEGLIDLVIPRGGEALIKAVTQQARVPVIKNAKGLCHVFIDSSADVGMAAKVCENAKCQRPGVCNAVETLLVHKDISGAFLPALMQRFRARDVEVRGDERVRAIVPEALPVKAEDWDTEYLDLIVSIKVVDSLQEAVAHIARHGSKHSEAIITEDKKAREVFLREVDAAAVYVNASTRFTDGGEFGLGAEIGISTDKLHARGPMGLEEITTYKYMIEGAGHIR